MEGLDQNILARHLAGNCSKEEELIIKKWVRKDSSNKQRLKEYKKIWDETAMDSKLKNTDFNTEQAWEVLKKQMNKIDDGSSSDSKNVSYFKLKNQETKYRIVRVAAIFLITVFIGFFAYQQWNQTEARPKEPILQEIVTKKGQRSHLTLSDGTHILLNANSKLKLPKHFKADIRKVFLQGQAYFEVAENTDKPFVISVGGTVVRVLGTSFSVSAYPEDHHIRVVVKKGRVSFRAKNKSGSNSAVITAHELAEYNEINNEMTIQKVKDLDLYLGWIEGSLNFEKVPMKNVARQLERRYGVEVVFSDPEIKKMVLTAYLKSKTIKNVLDVIAVSLKINYELKNNRVIFSNN